MSTLLPLDQLWYTDVQQAEQQAEQQEGQRKYAQELIEQSQVDTELQRSAQQQAERQRAAQQQAKKHRNRLLGYTAGGTLLGSGLTGGITSFFTENKKARVLAYLLGALGGGTSGFLLAKGINARNPIIKQSSLRKVASKQQIYKVARLLKLHGSQATLHIKG